MVQDLLFSHKKPHFTSRAPDLRTNDTADTRTWSMYPVVRVRKPRGEKTVVPFRFGNVSPVPDVLRNHSPRVLAQTEVPSLRESFRLSWDCPLSGPDSPSFVT